MASVFEEINLAGRTEWANLYGTKRRDWLHKWFESYGYGVGRSNVERLRMWSADPICKAHVDPGSTQDIRCVLCGHPVSDEFHLVGECVPDRLTTQQRRRLADLRAALDARLQATLNSGITVWEWLMAQGTEYAAAWCLGSEKLWGAARWPPGTAVEHKYRRTLNITADLLTIVMSSGW
jgi:hypothetical protein